MLKSYLYSVLGLFFFFRFFCYGRMYRLKLQSDLLNNRPVCCSFVVNFYKWSHLPTLNAVPNDKCIRICYIEFYGRCHLVCYTYKYSCFLPQEKILIKEVIFFFNLLFIHKNRLYNNNKNHENGNIHRNSKIWNTCFKGFYSKLHRLSM